MKIILPLVTAGLLLLVVPGTGAASVVWNNGAITGAGGQCDFTGGACRGGGDGFTIVDDFNLSDEIVVSGFTYDSFFFDGIPVDYSSTNWAIYDGDPITFGSAALVASGSAVAALSADSCSSPYTCTTTTFTVSGMSLDLAAGEYWLGYENVLTGGAETVDVYTLGSGVNPIPGFEQIDDQSRSGDSTYDTGDTAFTIEGAPPIPPPPSSAPEPSSLWLGAVAASACFVKSRSRFRYTPACSPCQPSRSIARKRA